MDERLMTALVNKTAGMPPVGAARNMPTPEQPIGEKEISAAADELKKYKAGKTMLELRVADDELWWEIRHGDTLRRKLASCGKYDGPMPSSAWLFNTILNKHADVMDNYPEPLCLPREESDRQSAETLSQILPVVMENNDFSKTYSDVAWEKLKHGTSVYCITWDATKENGLGDISITGVDLLNIFWEPGISDIQKSRNLFIVELVDTDLLDEKYPQYKGRFGGKTVDVKEYYHDDTVDNTQKSVVVDWYYKVRRGGRTILHFAKFCNDVLLYASENDPEYAERGYYDHGLYPVVFDTLFPEKGSPAGFGYIAVTKNPQMYIDLISANILESSRMATKKRFFVSTSTNVNQEQFSDWNKQIVPVEGEISDTRIQEIQVAPISGVYLDVVAQKIDELKDTAGNRDVNSGQTSSGVTAAAAIAALQEAGNKTSRDLIKASYRAQTEIAKLCIELMRQFYDVPRAFRIAGPGGGDYTFAEFSNAAIKEKMIGRDADGMELYRKPVFDLKIKAQRKNPFSTMEANERAKELYGLGFFNPERAQEAMGALQMMEFEGKEQTTQYVQQGQTLLALVQQMAAKMDQMAAMLGMEPTQGGPALNEQETPQTATGGMADRMTRETMKAATPQTPYMQSLAGRSTPEVKGS